MIIEIGESQREKEKKMVNNRRRKNNQLILGITLAIGIGTSCYYLWKSLQNGEDGKISDTPIKDATNDERNKSRCVVVTSCVINTMNVIPWSQLLEDEEDLVLIVIPSCKDRFHLKLDPRFAYKVIRCDTVLGVWSCIKSLKKQELYVNIEEFPDGERSMPDDIPRYVPRITYWKNEKDILTTFPI